MDYNLPTPVSTILSRVIYPEYQCSADLPTTIEINGILVNRN
ncbi:hypothetical Protein YC6258_01234 [Gynuella sunshinyii YC6258]|uniref:Uncharacterized protein n=1 Tax=Gynuella sunshinyii YC6258 TaxID=1445510 RepID=A0A0C5VFH1_9GAMM|nr:hypothetical Protein YC6258_01234 [Gynuella sunshinyii YC6258]